MVEYMIYDDFDTRRFAVSLDVRAPFSYYAKETSAVRFSKALYLHLKAILQDAFPVLSHLLSPEAWTEVTREFYYHIWEEKLALHTLPETFVKFIQAGEFAFHFFPGMLDLAQFEWLKLNANMQEYESFEESEFHQENAHNGELIVLPQVWLMSSDFPVHLMMPGYCLLESAKRKTHLIIAKYRDGLQVLSVDEISAKAVKLLQADLFTLGELTNNLMTLFDLKEEERSCVVTRIQSLCEAGIVLTDILNEERD